jgi:putative thiamine transport system ATP-binding protein
MLELTSVRIATAQRVLVADLSAQVAGGEVLVVMGPSGAGKSALLAYLCGTLPAALQGGGEVRVDGVAVQGLPTVQRRIGILFQDDLLFPHMSVLDNLLFAVPAGPAAQRIAQATQALAQSGLEGFGSRLPATLSGGQRSRVAVLRALLARPRALLLDEPFSRLDTALRERFRSFVFERLRSAGVPAVLVTHDRGDVPAGARVFELDAQGSHA